MQIISPAQCRAARALLNWSQPDLAERCGIHVQTISNFEKESSTPSKNTLAKIMTVLELAGIQVTDDDGVKRKQESIRQYHGADGFRLFMNDVYETAKAQGGEICLLNAKPDNWVKWLGQEWFSMHAERMEKLSQKLIVKITTRKGEYNFISRRFAEYRWVPKEIWNQHSFYAYGDRVAFLNFENDDVNIFVLKHAPFAQTHKFLFNLVWDQHTIIPDTPDHKHKKK